MPTKPQPSVDNLRWSQATIKPQEEARGHGFVSVPEAMGKDNIEIGAVRNRVLNGWYEVIPIGEGFDEVMVKAADLGKRKAPRGQGPYRDTTFRMLTDESRLLLANEKQAASAPSGYTGTTVTGTPAFVPPAAREVVNKIAALVGGTPGAGTRAILERVAENGRRVWLQEMPAQTFGQGTVLDKWGGGDYAVRVVQNGAMLDEFLFTLPGAAKDGFYTAGSGSGSRGSGTMNDEELIKALKATAPEAPSTVDLVKAMAEQGRATTDAMRTGFEIAKAAQPAAPATPPLQEFQTVVLSIMQAGAQDHKHLLEQMSLAHTQAMEREKARADEFLGLERERAASREKEVQEFSRLDRERNDGLLKSMREADAKVHESLKGSIEVQQKSIEREYGRLREDEALQRQHLEEIRRLKAENPDEAALRTLGVVLNQADHMVGRIGEIKYGVRTGGNGHPALGTPNGNGNGHAAPGNRLPAPDGAEKASGTMPFDLGSIKTQVFKAAAFKELLGEAERHVKGNVPPGNLAAMLVAMANEDNSLMVALNLIAGRSIAEVLAETGHAAAFPALASEAGQKWFEGLKARLFRQPHAEAPTPAEAPAG